MTDVQPMVFEVNGPRGGGYYAVDLADDRRMLVSRKTKDRRVWLGRRNEPTSYDRQRGGIGTIENLLGQWFARIAMEPETADLYWALSALVSSRRA